jgi:hypothetical protein
MSSGAQEAAALGTLAKACKPRNRSAEWRDVVHSDIRTLSP